MSTHEARRSLFGLMSAVARSGECMDCWAIEGKLRTLGFSAVEARGALADADDRKALLTMCVAARTTANEQLRMKDAAAFRNPAARL